MPVLTLGYRHCDRKRPSYIKNSEIEGIAVLARQQLVEFIHGERMQGGRCGPEAKHHEPRTTKEAA